MKSQFLQGAVEDYKDYKEEHTLHVCSNVIPN